MNRGDFPIFDFDNTLVYFDNGATTMKPKCVIDTILNYNTKYTANAHRGDYKNSLIVDTMYDETREKVRKYINAKEKSEIVFTSGATESLNMIVMGYFKNILKENDEVLITEAEHASNVLPWFVLQKELGIKVNYIKLDDNNEVTLENVKSAINKNTKVISIAHVTNVIGDVRPIKEISKIAHENNIYMVVDAAQSIAHTKVDVQELDIDFMAFSSHKMYSTTGCGVLYGKFDLLDNLTPINYGGGMNAMFTKDGYYELREIPTRLEAGTPNISAILALGSAIDYINSIGIDNIYKYEHDLRKYLVQELSKLDFITVYNKNNDSAIIAFNINGVFSQDTAVYLDKYNICVRAGNHCAKLLKDELGIKNTCRVSFYLYNTKEEIDKLIEALKNSKNIFEVVI